MKNKLIALNLLLLLGIIWGSGFSLAKYVISHGVNFVIYTFWQTIGPGIILFIVAYLKYNKVIFQDFWQFKKQLFIVAILGILIPNTIMYYTASKLPAGILALIVNTVPLIIYPCALLFQEEKFNLLRFSGVFLGLFSLSSLFFPNTHWKNISISTITLAMITPLCFSLTIIYINKNLTRLNSLSCSTWMMLIAAMFLLPINLYWYHNFTIIKINNFLMSLIFLKIIVSAIGYFLLFILVKTAGSVYYSFTNCIVAITGIIWGYIIFNETINFHIIMIVLFMIIAIICATISQQNSK